MQGADEIREAQRKTWVELSAGWDKWESSIMEQLAPVGEAIIRSLDIKVNQQHLDIASGTGEPGLSIAKLASSGRVVLSDLVPEMLSIAKRRADLQGLTNIEVKVCSADDLPFDDSTFDSVSVRFGYMFFPDVVKATEEFVRVLKPGGRLCASVWIKPEENPWTMSVARAVASEIELPPLKPGDPNMFRCAAPEYVSDLYKRAGLTEVSEWEVPIVKVSDSLEEFWEMVSEHSSLAVSALKKVDESTRARIRERVIREVSVYEEDGKIRVPGLAKCILAIKSATN